MTSVNAATKSATKEQIRLTRRSPAYWRVTIDNPPINVMGPEMVRQFQEVINALEADEHVRVVVFDSAVEDYFLNHSDFMAKLEDLTSMPSGPTGLPPWPDFLVRLTRLPVASIALIRGRATGNGSEITLACDMSFASREKAIISQWEVGVGMVAGGGPMARLPRLIGRNRALEVLLSSDDIRGEQAEAYGYVNRALPDADLDAFVEALATRIAGFDKWAIANTKRLVNTSLPPDVELGAGWDACIASLGRPAAQDGIKALTALGLPQAGGCRKTAWVLPGPNRTLACASIRVRMEDFMDAKRTFLVALLALATAIPGTRISAAPNPEGKSGVDRLYVIDCGDGSGPDESRWTPGANVGTPVDFPGHCYLIHHTQGWFLWDTGIDDAVAQLPNHERVFHEWGPGTGPIWRKPITLAAQLEEIHVKPSDIKLMAVSHSHPDHAGNIEMFPNTLMLVQRVEYEWAGSRQDTVAFNKKHPVKLIDGDYDIFGDGSLVLLSTPGHTPGHQSLLVRLPKTGPVILSGDVVHFQTSFENRYVPTNNWSKQASLRSMDKIAAIIAKEHAQLWINHDQSQSDAQKKLPAYYE